MNEYKKTKAHRRFEKDKRLEEHYERQALRYFYMDPRRRRVQLAEMREACELLFEWEDLKPVIAGGALWSWAAGRTPKDIDVFIGTAMLDRNAQHLLGQLKNNYEETSNDPKYADEGDIKTNTEEEEGVNQVELELRAELARRGQAIPEELIIKGKEAIERYNATSTLVVSDSVSELTFDIVLTPWDPAWPYRHFDYHHVMVGFGPYHCSYEGMHYYANGWLEPTRKDRLRPEEKVRRKLQPQLWGSPLAAARLKQVMTELQGIYNQIVSEETRTCRSST